MIGRPLHEEASLGAAPPPLPDWAGAQRPEPTPPELFGADAESALVEAGAGEVLEKRGPLASFAAEGLGGSGSGGSSGGPSEARGRGAGGAGPRTVVHGFDTSSESGGPAEQGHGADIDLAAPERTAGGGVALSGAGAAAMPGLLRLSAEEKALKEGWRRQE